MIESRMHCPVCLGVLMVKESPPRANLTLDLCRRCGGIWFEAGEFQRLRSGPRIDLAKSPEGGPHTTLCQACLARIRRDADSCSACGAPNRIDCPHCHRPASRITHDGLTLDVCDRCRGVWFDRHEIAAIWTVAVSAAVQARTAGYDRALGVTVDGASTMVDALLYNPELGGVIVEGSLRAAGHALEGLAAAPEAAGFVVDVAGTVFEALASLVGAILEGIAS